MFSHKLKKIIFIFALGCFAWQNARADLLFPYEWNLDGQKNFKGEIEKVEEYLFDKLVLTYIFNEQNQLIETQFEKNNVPYSFRYSYNDAGKLEKVELFNRQSQKVESEERAAYNESGEIIRFESYAGGELIKKTSAVMDVCGELKRTKILVFQDKENKISELHFDYNMQNQLEYVRYFSAGELKNVVRYSYNSDGLIVSEKNFGDTLQKDGEFTSSYSIDSNGNWIKKIRQNDRYQWKITRKIKYRKSGRSFWDWFRF